MSTFVIHESGEAMCASPECEKVRCLFIVSVMLFLLFMMHAWHRHGTGISITSAVLTLWVGFSLQEGPALRLKPRNPEASPTSTTIHVGTEELAGVAGLPGFRIGRESSSGIPTFSMLGLKPESKRNPQPEAAEESRHCYQSDSCGRHPFGDCCGISARSLP